MSPASAARELMLDAYDRGQPVRPMPFPCRPSASVEELTLLALGGEVGRGLRPARQARVPRREPGVAGYCHDVMCYIPSRRVLRGGRLRAGDSMIYYGQPGPFTEDVEDLITAGVRRVAERVGLRPGGTRR